MDGDQARAIGRNRAWKDLFINSEKDEQALKHAPRLKCDSL